MGAGVNEDHGDLRSTGTWIETTDGWFVSTYRIKPGTIPSRFVVYDHEGPGQREIPPWDVLAVERVESEGLYQGHWIPLVSISKSDETAVWSPVPRDQLGSFAMLYYDNGPEFDAIAAIPGAAVHDPRSLYGGVSLRVPVPEIEDYREKVIPLAGSTSADSESTPR